MRTPVINPQLEFLFPHTLLVYLVSSVSLYLLTCDREDLCTHLSGQALRISVPVLSCLTLLSSTTFFFPFPCLPAKWIFFFFCHAPPPLHQFDLCLPHEQSCLQVLSCVSLVFKFLSFLLTVHWLGYMCFPCSASFILISIFYSYGLFLESLTLALFVVIYLNGQVNNSYSLIQTPKTA